MIISQCKDKITSSLEFSIQEMQTCRNEFISKENWQKFKKITQKKDEGITLNELKGLGEFLGKNMTKTVFTIIEVKSNRNFGIFTTKDKAKQELQEILKSIEEKRNYQIQEDKKIGLIMA